MSQNKKKRLTLTLILTGGKILLGMKKRGFGQGRWNGFGGKISPGETVEAAARREVLEEAGVTVGELTKRGVLTFHIRESSELFEVHLFSADQFEGTPKETDEMRPHWFPFDAIPYDTMWPDDYVWLPKFLEGKNVRGEFFFDDINTLVSYTLTETGALM